MSYAPVEVTSTEEYIELLRSSCKRRDEQLFMGLSLYGMCSHSFEIDRELAIGLLDLAESASDEDVAGCCLGHMEEQSLSEGCKDLTKRILALLPSALTKFKSGVLWFGVIRVLHQNVQTLEFDQNDRNLVLDIYRKHLHVTEDLSTIIYHLFCKDHDRYGMASKSSGAN